MLPTASDRSRIARKPAGCALSKTELAALVQAGMICRETQRFQQARDVFATIRGLDPGNPIAEIGLGATCFSQGYFAEANGHYRQALKLNPHSAYAYALLGESQIFEGEPAAARVSLCRAYEIDRRGPYGQLAQNLLRFLESLSKLESAAKDRQE
ncbi:MAG: tetratricopeptide repeat protein [Acidobacteriaceae bacterium]|nr:tetratricopeptide repeat protein [Acidobacteriaceae bacterium]